MTAPKPDRIKELLDDIATRGPELLDAYRWLYPMGYERRSGGGEKVATSTTSDPVCGVVLDGIKLDAAGRRQVGLTGQGRARLEVDTAARLVAKARNDLNEALMHLNRAARHIDGQDGDHTPDEHHDTRPRLISRAELADAQAAKGRRSSRGEGWGEG